MPRFNKIIVTQSEFTYMKKRHRNTVKKCDVDILNTIYSQNKILNVWMQLLNYNIPLKINNQFKGNRTNL